MLRINLPEPRRRHRQTEGRRFPRVMALRPCTLRTFVSKVGRRRCDHSFQQNAEINHKGRLGKTISRNSIIDNVLSSVTNRRYRYPSLTFPLLRPLTSNTNKYRVRITICRSERAING